MTWGSPRRRNGPDPQRFLARVSARARHRRGGRRTLRVRNRGRRWFAGHRHLRSRQTHGPEPLRYQWIYFQRGRLRRVCLCGRRLGRFAVGGNFNRVSSLAGLGELEVPGLVILNGPAVLQFQSLDVLGDGTFRFSLQVEPGGTYVLES
jgi:hypothetical protein